jgi:hypothetical protein
VARKRDPEEERIESEETEDLILDYRIMTCMCGFDGWTIYTNTVQCIRCDSIYEWSAGNIEAFNLNQICWLIKEGWASGPWPPPNLFDDEY